MRYLYCTIANICHSFLIAVRTLDTLEVAVFEEKCIFLFNDLLYLLTFLVKSTVSNPAYLRYRLKRSIYPIPFPSFL